MRTVQPAAAHGETIRARRTTPAAEHAPPIPAAQRRRVRIRHVGAEGGVVSRIARGDVKRRGRPGQFVVVHEGITAEGDHLIRAILAVARDGRLEELPALQGFRQIVGRRDGIRRLERRRTRNLRQRSHRCGRRRRVLGQHQLQITVIRRHVQFVLPRPRIHNEIKSAVRILQLRQVVRFPLRLLDDVADAVTTLRQAEIVQVLHSGQRVHREGQMMDQRRDRRGVLAVISSIVMSATGVNQSGVHKRIQTGGHVHHARRRVTGIAQSANGFLVEHVVHEVLLRPGRGRNQNQIRVTHAVREPRIRHHVVRAATIVIETQRIRPRVRRRHAFIN